MPGRSFLYFEWSDQRENESAKQFQARQKIEQADHVQYFHLQAGLENTELDNRATFCVAAQMSHGPKSGTRCSGVNFKIWAYRYLLVPQW